MLEIPDDRCERHRLFKAIDDGFRIGDFDALGVVLGGSPRWFDEKMPFELGLGHPLEYAIYWSPLEFVAKLLLEGANPNYEEHAGFPALIAALSTKRPDRTPLIALLLGNGADPDIRGVNDWTALHYAVAVRDADAIALLLGAGADPFLRTRIDDRESALEMAEAAGFGAGAALLREAISSTPPANRRR